MVEKRTEEGLEDMWQQMGYLESMAIFTQGQKFASQACAAEGLPRMSAGERSS